MNSALNIIKDGALHDFQKNGYFNNIFTGAPVAADEFLIPFFYAFSNSLVTYEAKKFKLQLLDCNGNVKAEHNIPVIYLTVYDNGEMNYFMYNANYDILSSLTSYDDGMYRYMVEVGLPTKSSGDIYYSEVFEIATYKLNIPDFADFNEDFNNDFLI